MFRQRPRQFQAFHFPGLSAPASSRAGRVLAGWPVPGCKCVIVSKPLGPAPSLGCILHLVLGRIRQPYIQSFLPYWGWSIGDALWPSAELQSELWRWSHHQTVFPPLQLTLSPRRGPAWMGIRDTKGTPRKTPREPRPRSHLETRPSRSWRSAAHCMDVDIDGRCACVFDT